MILAYEHQVRILIIDDSPEDRGVYKRPLGLDDELEKPLKRVCDLLVFAFPAMNRGANERDRNWARRRRAIKTPVSAIQSNQCTPDEFLPADPTTQWSCLGVAWSRHRRSHLLARDEFQ